MNDNNEKLYNYVDMDGNIYLLGEFDDTISKNVTHNLVKLIDEQSALKEGTINFYINSNGGYDHELFNLLALIAIAKQKGIKITTTVLGRAYSAASLLAVQGDYRRMYKHADHLLHYGTASGEAKTPVQATRLKKHLDTKFNYMLSLYTEHTKLTRKWLEEHMYDDDLRLNAQECLKYGLVDEVIG